MCKLSLCAHYFLNFINMLDINEMYAAPDVGYFYKNWIHAQK